MAHYVILDENNFVINGHVGRDEDDIVLDNNGNPIDWEIYYGAKRTSYNTYGGIHYTNGQPSLDQGKAFRKNYAGIGYFYDEVRDAFIPPKPFPSWTLEEFSCLWNSPIPYPDTSNIPEPYKIYNRYVWNEDIINWDLMKPFDSWSLNQDNYYVSPIPYPNDGNQYYWDEENKQWNIYNT